jgi:hypothetical protein
MRAMPSHDSADFAAPPDGRRADRRCAAPPIGFFVKALVLEFLCAAAPAWLAIRYYSTFSSRTTSTHLLLFGEVLALLAFFWAWFVWTRVERELDAAAHERRAPFVLMLCAAAAWLPAVWTLTAPDVNATAAERAALIFGALISVPAAWRAAHGAVADLAAWRAGTSESLWRGLCTWGTLGAAIGLLWALPKTYYVECERLHQQLSHIQEWPENAADATAVRNLAHEVLRIKGPYFTEACRRLVEVGDATSVPLLIAVLQGIPEDRLALDAWRYCRRALWIITNQEPGLTHAQLSAWYARNRARSRPDWIVEGFNARGTRVSTHGSTAESCKLLELIGKEIETAIGESRHGGWLNWARCTPRLLLTEGVENLLCESYSAYVLLDSYDPAMLREVVATLVRSGTRAERLGCAVFAACTPNEESDAWLRALRKDQDCTVRWYASTNLLRGEQAAQKNSRSAVVETFELPVQVTRRSTISDHGILYGADLSRLFAYDLRARALLWSTERPTFLACLLVDAMRAYVVTDGGEFVCVTLADGRIAWRTRLELAQEMACRLSACGRYVLLQEYDAGTQSARQAIEESSRKTSRFSAYRKADGMACAEGEGDIAATGGTTMLLAQENAWRCVTIPPLAAAGTIRFDGEVDSLRICNDAVIAFLYKPAGAEEGNSRKTLWVEAWALPECTPKYARQLSLSATSIESVLVHSGTMYVSGDGATWAIDTAGGAVLWQNQFGGRLLAAGERLLLYTDTILTILDRARGDLTGVYALPGELYLVGQEAWPAFVADDRVLFCIGSSLHVVELPTD